MNHLRSFSVFVTILAICFSNSIFAAVNTNSNVDDEIIPTIQTRAGTTPEQAQEFNTLIQQNWLREKKEEIFRLAKEQDKYIFLLYGSSSCGNCYSVVTSLSKDPLLKIVENEYIMWFTLNGNMENLKEIQVYMDELLANVNQSYLVLPLFFIIDPNDPTKAVTYNYGVKSASYLSNYMTFELPLKQGLRWYEDTNVIFDFAKTQKKLIFKFVGTGTSNNTKEVLKLLESQPLSQILSDNYILWYKRYKDPAVTTSSDFFTQDEPDTEDTETPEEIIKTAPYIYIIDPEKPNENIVSLWGLQDVETLKDWLEDPFVSNENIDLSDNKVSLNNNILYISNNIDNETISIYSITGQQIDVIQKKEQSISVSASFFPNGFLIIHSSKGWSAKVVKNQ